MQDNKDFISVGIPFFNAEKFLPKAIESVINQSHQNWELLLVDDGSTDGSLEIAKKFQQQDNRIKVFHDGKNKGLAVRLNELVNLSQGVYIARMDADDIMHPKRLEKQIQVLQQHPNIDVLGTNAYTIDENNLVFGRRFNKTEGLQKVESFIHPTIMAKKQWFLDNPYDEKAIRIEDIELWYRAKHHSDFMMVNEPLLFYREFGNNYFKKYFLANSSESHILKKYPKDRFWEDFFRLNKIKGSIYWFLNIIGKEQILINKRSEEVFDNKIALEKWLEVYESK